jgi:hypothetical protein
MMTQGGDVGAGATITKPTALKTDTSRRAIGKGGYSLHP